MDFDLTADQIVDRIDWIVTDPATVRTAIAEALREAEEAGYNRGYGQCRDDAGLNL
jgi:hypothetical protein